MPERYLGQTLGKYRVESLIGSGGFAWVFKGHDPELDISVAIKVLKPQFAGDEKLVDRFKNEASTAAKLGHPNIVKIYAVGKQGDAVYFVMDYLPTGLAEKLEATTALPEDYVIRVGIDVARALGFAHRQGVIHRDIKVDNILFDQHGNAIVADFGIARAVTGYTQHTGTNMVVGTPQYFAPEQARAKPLDGRADIYSLGVTMFRAATGRLPFEGDDWYEIARQHVEEPPPTPRSILPSLSAGFDRIVLRCLSKSPDDRPATGEQLAEELEQILAHHKDPTLARTLTIPATVSREMPAAPGATGEAQVVGGRRRLRKRVVLPLVALVLVALGVVGWMLRFGRATPPTIATSRPDSATPPIVIPPAISPADSARSKSDSGQSKAGAAKDTLTHLVFTGPADSRLSLNGAAVGDEGKFKSDSLPSGNYRITATVNAPAGCKSATDSTVVQLKPGRRATATLHPRSCGTLAIEFSVSSARARQAGALQYMVSSNGVAVYSGDLPLAAPLVLPVGVYQLDIRQPNAICTPYSDRVTIVANDGLLRRGSLICSQ